MTVADLILKYLVNEGVEYVFGISGAALNNFLVAFNRNPRIKTARGFRRFSFRGLSKVQAEWQLICLTHNLLKLFRAGWRPQAA